MSARKIVSTTALVLVSLGIAGIAAAADVRHEERHNGYVFDHRYGHDHYYPPRGYAVRALPRDYAVARFHDSPYYFRGGVWYRPYGPRFVVVAPPIGLAVAALPGFYTTVWFGGIPYYYCNDAYYLWRPEQHAYVVTDPPAGVEASTTGAPGGGTPDTVFVYPRNGQSQQQQDGDRYECHSWAASQSGFDPTRPLGGVDESQTAGKRAEYQRAEAACLDARGYSVK
jgi:hypothetical protein